MKKKEIPYNDEILYIGAIQMNTPRVNLIEFIESLSIMEKTVLKIRTDNPGITNVDVARLLVISEGRVRQIRKQIQCKYTKIAP